MHRLDDIAQLLSGIYTQPDIQADTLYLQSVHFDDFGAFKQEVKPQIKSDDKTSRHLLSEGDILFAAKGVNNFAVVYQWEMGKAVASSSFVVIRVKEESKSKISMDYLAWYLCNHPEVKLFHKQLGTTIPSISIRQLSKLAMNIPDLETQRMIVNTQQLRNQEKQIYRKLDVLKDQLIKHQLLNATK